MIRLFWRKSFENSSISDENVREFKKLTQHFEETFTKDANSTDEPYLNQLVEKTITY